MLHRVWIGSEGWIGYANDFVDAVEPVSSVVRDARNIAGRNAEESAVRRELFLDSLNRNSACIPQDEQCSFGPRQNGCRFGGTVGNRLTTSLPKVCAASTGHLFSAAAFFWSG